MRGEQGQSRSRGGLALIALVILAGAALRAGAEPALQLVKSIPLPGVEGRVDHMDYDLSGGRLFVAALGNGSVEVVAAASSAVIASIRGISEPQGVAFVADARKLYVTSAGSGECLVYDGASFAPVRRIALGGDADNLHYDALARRLYISAGERIQALSVSDDTLLSAAALPGHPEGFAVPAGQAMIYVNVPLGSRGVFVVDRRTMAVVSRWQVGGALANLFSNFPLAVDDEGRRLFVATRVPPALAVIDTSTGRTVASVRIDGDADDVFYDAARRRLYVSCGAGWVDVIDREGADGWRSTGRIPTAAGARTSLWVASLDTLFVAAPRRGDQEARVLVFRAEGVR